jgi:hypothetical protein
MLEEYIKRLFHKLFQSANFSARVVEVDKDTATCTVQPAFGPEKYDVRLTATQLSYSSRFVIYPKLDSTVICSVLHNEPTEAYVSQFSEIEEVEVAYNGYELLIGKDGIAMNSGIFGGLVKVQALTEKINRLEQRLNTHQHTYVSASGAPAVTTPDPASNTPLVPTNRHELENEDVLH